MTHGFMARSRTISQESRVSIAYEVEGAILPSEPAMSALPGDRRERRAALHSCCECGSRCLERALVSAPLVASCTGFGSLKQLL